MHARITDRTGQPKNTFSSVRLQKYPLDYIVKARKIYSSLGQNVLTYQVRYNKNMSWIFAPPNSENIF